MNKLFPDDGDTTPYWQRLYFVMFRLRNLHEAERFWSETVKAGTGQPSDLFVTGFAQGAFQAYEQWREKLTENEENLDDEDVS